MQKSNSARWTYRQRSGSVIWALNDVMRIVKELQPQIIAQQFDNLCTMTLAIRQGFAAQLLDRLSKVEGLELETDDQ